MLLPKYDEDIIAKIREAVLSLPENKRPKELLPSDSDKDIIMFYLGLLISSDE